MIGLSTDRADPDRAVGDRPLDRQAPADGRARCRQRVRLGHARPAAPGPGRPGELRDRKVTLSQVVTTAGNAQVVSPLSFLEASTPGTGGFVETPQQRLQVRHLLEKIADPAELAKVPVAGTEGATAAGRRRDHQGRPPAADRRRRRRRRTRAWSWWSRSSRASARRRSPKDVQEALETLRPGLAGIDTTDTCLPAGGLRRRGQGQPGHLAGDRPRSDAARPGCAAASTGAALIALLVDRPAVHRRGGTGPAAAGPGPERAGPRRAGGRRRGGGGRGDRADRRRS